MASLAESPVSRSHELFKNSKHFLSPKDYNAFPKARLRENRWVDQSKSLFVLLLPYWVPAASSQSSGLVSCWGNAVAAPDPALDVRCTEICLQGSAPQLTWNILCHCFPMASSESFAGPSPLKTALPCLWQVPHWGSSPFFLPTDLREHYANPLKSNNLEPQRKSVRSPFPFLSLGQPPCTTILYSEGMGSWEHIFKEYIYLSQ